MAAPLAGEADCVWCGAAGLVEVMRRRTAVRGENLFGVDPARYERVLAHCPSCGHFANLHDHAETLHHAYVSDYRLASYSDALKRTFERIMALPPGASDNLGRVETLRAWLAGASGNRLLDVGSGSCVFGAAMRTRGWEVTVVDVDDMSTRHAREVAGVAAVTGYFLDIAVPVEGKLFDLVTFNKVLEHLPSELAVAMLRHGLACLVPGGHLYLELPDGEAAIAEGPERQEFYFEHFGAFSAASLALMVRRSGLTLLRLERRQEPSGKYTLRALLAPSLSR